jgi:outer membrane protein OmpA-like peptidoglycan-associated protein
MENKFTTTRAALALFIASAMSGCSTTPPANTTPVALAKPVQLAIAQVGTEQTARFVYCEESSCPVATPKTPVAIPAQLPVVAHVFPPQRLLSLEIAFPFNSSRVSDNDKKLLADALSSYTGGEIKIIARSDFVGPKAGQMKVVDARAKAMRSIVAKQTQDAQIEERQEVAGPDRVPASQQAHQRRGSVRFDYPIDASLKGNTK